MLEKQKFSLVLLLICCLTYLDRVAAEPLLIVAGSYTRNYGTAPSTVEIPLHAAWQFSCRWTRQNASQQPFLAIDAPAQRGYCNCQFGVAGKPPQCTPSSVQFDTDQAGQQQSSNVTCQQAGNSLTCSISLEAVNPRHIGIWSCRSLSEGKNDSAYVQYYKTLPDESLALTSWDPIAPINETAVEDPVRNSSLPDPVGNRFECYTKEAVMPPARLAFYLGGVELTTEQTRYPVEWLGGTEYSEQPRMLTLNRTEPTASIAKFPLRQDLKMNQRLLASNRILRIKLLRSYNSLLLECRASQQLVSGRTLAKSLVLHLDVKNPGMAQLFSRPTPWIPWFGSVTTILGVALLG